MPITFNILNQGHFIHAKTHGNVTGLEFVEFEVAHAIDKRLKPPVVELLEIENDSLKNISEKDITNVIDQRDTANFINFPFLSTFALK